MPEREIITNTDVCELSERWAVDLDTMRPVWQAAEQFSTEFGGTPVWIISGWRSRDEQRQLNRQGRPTADDDLSTHRSCPATGVDVSLSLLPSNLAKATWGRIAVGKGLRWGGGGPLDEETGMPLDWGHVDRGPRN